MSKAAAGPCADCGKGKRQASSSYCRWCNKIRRERYRGRAVDGARYHWRNTRATAPQTAPRPHARNGTP